MMVVYVGQASEVWFLGHGEVKRGVPLEVTDEEGRELIKLPEWEEYVPESPSETEEEDEEETSPPVVKWGTKE